MRKAVLFTSFFLLSGLSPAAQQNPTPTPDQVTSDAKNGNAGDVTYGRIKEVQAGNKIVISVENGKDRTYNLSSPRTAVSVAEDLASGDAVKILETRQKNGRSVQIVRDIRPDAGQGEQKRGRTTPDKKQ